MDFDKNLKLGEIKDNMKALDKNLIILRNQTGFSSFKRVDVWWSSRENGNFMVLLAYLITHSSRWLKEGAIIKVFHIADEKTKEEDIKWIEKMLEESRIENVELEIIKKEKDEKVNEIINKNSADSDLVILGLTNLGKADNKKTIDHIEKFTKKLKVSVLVSANDKIDFRVN